LLGTQDPHYQNEFNRALRWSCLRSARIPEKGDRHFLSIQNVETLTGFKIIWVTCTKVIITKTKSINYSSKSDFSSSFSRL
jgi:hypothetical protein